MHAITANLAFASPSFTPAQQTEKEATQLAGFNGSSPAHPLCHSVALLSFL